MLKNWAVKNFKSFKAMPPIELSMVNVLAGANSSGKSTLIQSILLLKQTLQYGTEDRPITLNGPMLRLGSFNDIKNFSSDDSSLDIQLCIDIKDSETRDGKPHWGRSTNYSFGGMNQVVWKKIKLSLSFGAAEENDELFAAHVSGRVLRPALLSTSLSVAGEDDEASRHQKFALTADKENPFDYNASLDDGSLEEILVGRPAGTVRGGFVNYFLPDVAIVRYNQTLLDVESFVTDIVRPRSILGSFYRTNSDERVSSDVLATINQWLTKNKLEPVKESDDGTALLSDVQKAFEQRRRTPANLVRGLGLGLGLGLGTSDPYPDDLDQLKETLATILLNERETVWRHGGGRPTGIAYSCTYLIDFFKFGVRYLGPLRDSPRPVYQPEALESTTDVGYRGEHTAAVFEMNKRLPVTYFIPPNSDIEDNYVSAGESRVDPLEVATAAWLEYLGVAATVDTVDAGVYGNRMQVSLERDTPLHDLTNVGVGVSQVLPIVVMSLLAPEGSLLIFEQPELHLHPKVQARLADFFLALALVGKQTLLETHSEYLVDRLRLRIATSERDDVRPLVNILFSERNGGCSTLTPVEISEFGSIVNWPADFFEQSQKDVGRIIQAASRKRKNKVRKSHD